MINGILIYLNANVQKSGRVYFTTMFTNRTF